MLEELLVRHCAPTLFGLKTANMFATTYRTKEDVHDAIRSLNERLRRKGLRLMPLRYTAEKVLIYVYRPEWLKRDLMNCKACTLLKERGYCPESLGKCIGHLTQVLRNGSDFPHEIGLFLGYPPGDVQGFMEQGASKCKLSGCWKVYGDVESARKLFSSYKKCTEICYSLWSEGKSIEWLSVVA